MQLWFMLAVAGPALWATSNYIDKYLTTRYVQHSGVGALIIISSVFAVVFLPLLWIMQPQVLDISLINIVLLITGSVLATLTILVYLYAIRDEELSIVMPFFELISVFSFLIGYVFLHETLTPAQIIGMVVIIGGAFVLSLDLKDLETQWVKIKYSLVGLMMLASLLYALSALVFKYVAVQEDFWVSTFWGYIGLILIGVILFICVPVYRRDFIHTIKTSGPGVMSLNALNETVTLVGNLAVSFATLLVPVALVYSIHPFQSVFVFAYGVILTIFAPHIYKENFQRRLLLQKVIGIVVILIGAWLVNK